MSSEMREFREALQDCVRAMDVARDTIQPITTAQIRLHNLNPQTDKLLDDAAAKALALLARTEAGADGAKDSRAAFEQWAKPQGYRLHIRDMPGSARLGHYGDDSTQAAWEAWTASRTGHPQDASGDAEKDAEIARLREALADLLSWFPEKPAPAEWRLLAGEYGADEAIAAARDAMQAKEAK